MTVREALAVLAVAYALAAAGVVWLFGPYGLIGAGLGLAAGALFVIDVKERHEAVASPPRRERRRFPVQHR
ncbi:hypothetical protein ABZU92_18370 [Micromonospora arida]|uniref:hypothetical protein n=1 Tax=Micromonospora arida TaxID=2203715 RepID=UPI0033B58210